MLVISGKLNHCFLLLMLPILATLAACNSSKKSTANLSAEEVQYRNTINSRAAKIVNELGITDSVKFYKVSDVIADQYVNLKDIHDARDVQKKSLKEKYADNKSEIEVQLKNIEKATEGKLATLHTNYLKKLSKYLNASQIDKVKDGMTYGVFPLTYKAHLEMIPSLKEEEKKYIWDALYEAREKAMDGGSSDEKHTVFGKYKGRINNYLASRGYDLKKEREEWNKRIQAAKKK